MFERKGDVWHTVSNHLLEYRASHNITRGQFGQLVNGHHKSLAILTQQMCSLATHRLADKESTRRILQVQSRWVELNELHIHNAATSLVGNSHAIADCCLRICCAGIYCRRAARGKKYVVGKEHNLATLRLGLQLLILAPAAHAIAYAILDEQVQQQCIFKYLNVIALQHLRDSKLRYPTARSIATGVQDTALVMSALKAQSQRAILGVELHTVGDNLLYAVGTLVHENIHRGIFTKASAGNQCIRLMYFWIIVIRCYSGNTALSIE